MDSMFVCPICDSTQSVALSLARCSDCDMELSVGCLEGRQTTPCCDRLQPWLRGGVFNVRPGSPVHDLPPQAEEVHPPLAGEAAPTAVVRFEAPRIDYGPDHCFYCHHDPCQCRCLLRGCIGDACPNLAHDPQAFAVPDWWDALANPSFESFADSRQMQLIFILPACPFGLLLSARPSGPVVPSRGWFWELWFCRHSGRQWCRKLQPR